MFDINSDFSQIQILIEDIYNNESNLIVLQSSAANELYQKKEYSTLIENLCQQCNIFGTKLLQLTDDFSQLKVLQQQLDDYCSQNGFDQSSNLLDNIKKIVNKEKDKVNYLSQQLKQCNADRKQLENDVQDLMNEFIQLKQHQENQNKDVKEGIDNENLLKIQESLQQFINKKLTSKKTLAQIAQIIDPQISKYIVDKMDLQETDECYGNENFKIVISQALDRCNFIFKQLNLHTKQHEYQNILAQLLSLELVFIQNSVPFYKKDNLDDHMKEISKLLEEFALKQQNIINWHQEEESLKIKYGIQIEQLTEEISNEKRKIQQYSILNKQQEEAINLRDKQLAEIGQKYSQIENLQYSNLISQYQSAVEHNEALQYELDSLRQSLLANESEHKRKTENDPQFEESLMSSNNNKNKSLKIFKKIKHVELDQNIINETDQF